jgi:hypothetical protein
MPKLRRVFHDHAWWLAAATVVAAISSRAPAQTFDHLKCYRVKDLRAQANVDYTVDLATRLGMPFGPETCRLESRARQLCVDTTKSNVSPPPPGAPSGASAQVYVCYTMRCTREADITIEATDQLGGSGLLQVKRHSAKRILCAPAVTPTTTTLPPCGNTAVPECNGACPPDAVCSPTGLALDVCACVSSTSPCGDTAPVCNGICPAGEECVAFEGIFFSNVCGCVATGSTPCGGSDCGVGVCPVGSECKLFLKHPLAGGYPFCGCGAPGSCDCPCRFACAVVPSLGCVPPGGMVPYCTGESPYPVCGGSCPGGDCRAFRIVSGFDACLCAPPEACLPACDPASCPSGMVCQIDTDCSCSCVAP